MKNVFVALLLFAFGLTSCSLINRGESATPYDATPPPDYRPVFVQTIGTFSPDSGSEVVISSADINQPNLIKLRVHILDTSRTQFLAGASGIKSIWCAVIDSFNNTERRIDKYNVYEISENAEQPFSIAIVMDHSGSMGEERARTVQAAALKIIESKRDNDRLALIKYDGRWVTECPITNSKSELKSKLKQNGLQDFGGLTAINDGILAGIDELASAPDDHIKSVIVFTDGQDNSSKSPKDSIISLAKAKGISISSIDFGDNINDAYMKEFSEATGGIYHHIYNTNEFNFVFGDIYKRLMNCYVIEYRPQDYGLHKVSIRLCSKAGERTATAAFNNTPNVGAIGRLSINFDFDKAAIKKESEEAIEGIFTLLKVFPTMVIELRGHTDSLQTGKDAEYNLKLSQKRADAVRLALIKKGIEPERMLSRGYGCKMPIAPNSTEEGRKQNRRTEFIILKK